MTVVHRVRPRHNGRLGWKRQLPDARDERFTVAGVDVAQPLPVRTTNAHDKFAAIARRDQLRIGSCTAHAAERVARLVRLIEGLPDFMGSTLAHYYWTRVIEGTVDSDAGAEIRDAIKVLAKMGVAPEKDWPYKPSKFKVKPTARATTDAHTHLAIKYLAVAQNATTMKRCLADGYPIDIGFSVYESGMSGMEAGVVPMPVVRRETLEGGHSAVAEDYDDDPSYAEEPVVLCANSWGMDVGLKSEGLPGYFAIPQRYILNPDLASDFWTVRKCD